MRQEQPREANNAGRATDLQSVGQELESFWGHNAVTSLDTFT